MRPCMANVEEKPIVDTANVYIAKFRFKNMLKVNFKPNFHILHLVWCRLQRYKF